MARQKYPDYNWDNFVLLLILTVATKITGYALAYSASTYGQIAVGFVLQLLAVGSLIALLGSYAYRITGRKSSIWVSLLGLLWLGFLGPIMGFFILRKWHKQSSKNS